MSCYTIDKKSLINNINVVKEKAGVPVIGVVKGNGYGFGITEMTKILKSCGIKTFAITETKDISTLKSILDDEDILILRSTTNYDEAKVIAENNCIATIGSMEACLLMDSVSKELGVKTRCHLKVDTGLSRYGFLPNETEKMLDCYKANNLSFCGIYTHFSHAFCDTQKTMAQYKTFLKTIDILKNNGIDPGCRHVANSPALFNCKDVSLDAVRIGSAFTGRVASKSTNSLIRTGYLQSEVLEIKTIPSGTTVGYGGNYTAKKDMKIAIVPMGHQDGFGITNAVVQSSMRNTLSAAKHWLHGDGLSVNINSKKFHVIGNVGLTHIAVDIDSSDVKLGDTVTADVSPLYVNANVTRKYI